MLRSAMLQATLLDERIFRNEEYVGVWYSCRSAQTATLPNNIRYEGDKSRLVLFTMERPLSSRVPVELKFVYCTCNYSRLLHIPCSHEHCVIRLLIAAIENGTIWRRISEDDAEPAALLETALHQVIESG